MQTSETLHWPPDVRDVEAIDLESREIAPVGSPGPPLGKSKSLRGFGAAVLAAVTRREDPSAGWRQLARRWALPVLAAVVVIESGWLIAREAGYRRGPAGPAQATTEAQTRAVQPPAAPTAQPVIPPPIALSEPKPAGSSGVPDTREHETRPPVRAEVATPVAEPGSLAIALPIQVEVYENGRFVGLNAGKPIPLAAGAHELELVNESLNYRASRRVNVASGKTTTVAPPLPSGILHLNATPWADVTIDGKAVGQTPLANVEVPIGPHQVVFTHPQLGAETRTVVVSARTPARVGVDLQKSK